MKFTYCVRLLLLSFICCIPASLFAVGWTPTDAGLVVNLQPGDKIMFSVEIDGTEYFVCHYNDYTSTTPFKYNKGNYMKLIPQNPSATEPSEASIWTVDTALTRPYGSNTYALGGTAYTIWSSSHYTLKTKDGTSHQFLGELNNNITNANLCDVVFTVPTVRPTNGVNMDPNGTLEASHTANGRNRGNGSAISPTWAFDGITGETKWGVYREVYMFDIPRSNIPRAYTNAALVTFNTTNSQKKWSDNQITCDPGRAAYAYADNKHKPTLRTLFRLYIINRPFNTCPDSYFFAHDEQSALRYRQSETMNDSTSRRKVYTVDWSSCMERQGETSVFKTDWMKIPTSDSVYYYVGKKNKFCNSGETIKLNPAAPTTAVSAFKNIDSMRVDGLKDKATVFMAPPGAYGRMVADSTSTKANIGVSFEPVGYFLKVQTPLGSTNVRMNKTGDNHWTTEEMWTIDASWIAYNIKTTLFTGTEYSATDPGADIDGWSQYVSGTSIPVKGHPDWTAEGRSGWARIYTDSADLNGHMEFILADATKCIKYDNNGFYGLPLSDQHPLEGENSVTIQAHRLKTEYSFLGWNTKADGTGVAYQAGDIFTFTGADTITLYAQATYTGSYNVTLSFIHPTNGKRYFLNHPGAAAPRYSRARHHDDWTNTWQGMANADNLDPNYVGSFELRHPSDEIKAKEDPGMADMAVGEMVLDPRRYVMRGTVDSLIFYENFSPAKDEYLGLYYTAPSTILANNSWAGLFTTTSDKTPTGWPDYKLPTIYPAKLKSERYVKEEDPVNHPDSLTLKMRTNNAEGTFVKYDPATNQFDACINEADATTFQISAIVVADDHYIILPDTVTQEWHDTIVFDYHDGEVLTEDVWSNLIGKQLLACMMVGADTTYFHPNRDKILTTPQALYLSSDFRLSQNFTLIPDARVASAGIPADDRVSVAATSDYWHNDILSGDHSPREVKYQGNYIDIVDTFRISLSHPNTSKIKKYYGRWANNAPGLHLKADGSRYRDVIIRTKTYHYGDPITTYVLTPKEDEYSFNPLAGNSKQIDFTLTRVTSKWLYDSENNPIREDITNIDTITTSLAMLPGGCSFSSGGTYFQVDEANYQQVTLSTKEENKSGDNHDTLIVSQIKIGDALHSVDVRIPLVQTALEGDELIWSVIHNGQRFFITAGSEGLIFRQYKLNNSTLYKINTNTHLIKGSLDAANSDERYITPWHFRYVESDPNQVTLKTEYGVDKHFVVSGETPGLSSSDSSAVTYRYAAVYTNTNANEEEWVRLKYGSDKWLTFNGTALVLQDDSASASVFSWGYLQQEYNLQNYNAYPSREEVIFGYNTNATTSVQTRYKAYKEYTMLLDNKLTHLCRVDENDIADLVSPSQEWLTDTAFTLIRDARTFDTPASSGLSRKINGSTLTTSITPSGASPREVKIGGEFVDIVDTLHVRLSLRDGAPDYRFADKWSSYTSIEQTERKIPLTRKTYHAVPYDSIVCVVAKDEHNYTFPALLGPSDSLHTFNLSSYQRTGINILNVDNASVAVEDATSTNVTVSGGMDLSSVALAEIRLVDEYGNTPGWCQITGKTATSITVKCNSSGIRAPRSAYLYLAYILIIDDKMRFVNFRMTVSQPSLFAYANNQHLVHSKGASGDSLKGGLQQVHENKRILYYYPDQNVELPIRERNFYGWWRWYREGKDHLGNDVSDTDIPDSCWRQAPRNVGAYNYPYRIIGDSVWVDEADHSKGKKLVTMGRYTVFYYPSKKYNNKLDPPAKSPLVVPPTETAGIAAKPTITYVADISNYYDNLPLSMKQIHQVDTAVLDTLTEIVEPTLSLREIFELHPWTEMADTLDHYKYPDATNNGSESYMNKYMEDHVVMAPLGNVLLLSTEQRYNYDNLKKHGHSESLMGYYMHDDNWSLMSATPDGDGWSRQDSMIWCGGWDADCEWYMYDAQTKVYSKCTHPITEENDFLSVPKKNNITTGQDADTIYYMLRSRSKSSPVAGPDPDEPADGTNWFNICRYMVIYHATQTYGPLVETNGKAIITNDEIEQHYEVLERLDFDYNRPGSDYMIYPHPLPWADASYGYTYPLESDATDNRYHDQEDFPNMGEYGIINRIPYSAYWRKMEQHGGAENGYMIYCDGMSTAGQVAAIKLNANLCEGQEMYFSGYVGNPSSQKNKACPNFTFSVQGSNDDVKWEDITSYMTGDIQPSDNWYQIYFPIDQKKRYNFFRVRIFNMASTYDGNDFTIDDMCIFATKPPLVAYQAKTTCSATENDSLTHVVLRVDYQGFKDESNNGRDMYYTIACMKDGDTTFVKPEDGYMNESINTGTGSKPDTIFGYIPMPTHFYEPTHHDSVFENVNDLILRFDTTYAKNKTNPYREGYIYEQLDGEVRPVLYVVHQAKMVQDNTYKVHMAASQHELMSSICAMTSDLKISNHITLVLNGEEQPDKVITGLCGNSVYDVSLHVKGSLFIDSVAPIELTGSCKNDWLLYGDTLDSSSEARYGYKYSDIVKVITRILRCEPTEGTNANQFAHNLSEVSKNEMARIKTSESVALSTSAHPYDILAHLVNKGYLLMYQSNLTTVIAKGDSLQYVIFPIVGTGSDAIHKANVEVCPTPVFIKLKPTIGSGTPLIIGGLHRDSTQLLQPIVVLASEAEANEEIGIKIDSISSSGIDAVVIDSIILTSTNDPNFLPGVHSLQLIPDRTYDFTGGDNSGYYKNNDMIMLSPAPKSYHMCPGFSYTFRITMRTRSNKTKMEDGCDVGAVPFILSVVPNQLRWNPKNKDNNRWNDPDNWIGINQMNMPIHDDAHFAPLATTCVVIPPLSDGLPYPELPDPATIDPKDSIQQVGFTYNTCDIIRFMTGSAITQQQRLDYNKVVVDLSLPQQKWALRSAPIKGMISGDVYMSNADLNWGTSPWEVGSFDANGRTYATGNASFWLSVYSRQVVQYGTENNTKNDTLAAAAEWSKVTNALTLSLPPAQGWAAYARTASGSNATIKLPKEDDIYYYYNKSGQKMVDQYEQNLNSKREELAGSGAGKLAFHPAGSSENYTITNEVASTSFVFGNPTMGYIDIWGFISDNSLTNEISYINAAGNYTTITKSAVEGTTDTITNLERYLPPMHAMVVTAASGTSLNVTLNTNRIVTKPSQVLSPLPAPARRSTMTTALPIDRNDQSQMGNDKSKGIMTVTAINPCSPRCTSRLLLGQGYHDNLRSGEDAILTTVNIDNFTMTNTPTTPFNIYAAEGGCGLSIDLRDSIVNVPVSFYMSDLPYSPTTQLWFTGVNNIDGALVLYDAQTDTEQAIIDGRCLNIETPTKNHQKRYYIRRRGYDPYSTTDPGSATGIETFDLDDNRAVKVIKDGHVLIIRDGHVYTMYGQKVK